MNIANEGGGNTARIDYQTYHYQWTTVWTERGDVERVVSGLRAFKHVTGIKVDGEVLQ